MGKKWSRLVALVLVLAICLAFAAGCSDEEAGGAGAVMPDGLSAKEKMEWGFSRLPAKISETLLTATGSDFLGSTSAGGTTETVIEYDFSGGGMQDGEITIVSTQNPETGDVGLRIEIDEADLEFGMYLVDDYLYIDAGAGIDMFRVAISEEMDVMQLLQELFDGIGELLPEADGVTFDQAAVEAFVGDMTDILASILDEGNFSEQEGTAELPGGKVDTERVVFELSKEALVALVVRVLESAGDFAASMSDTDVPDTTVPGQAPAAQLQEGYYILGDYGNYTVYYVDADLSLYSGYDGYYKYEWYPLAMKSDEYYDSYYAMIAEYEYYGTDGASVAALVGSSFAGFDPVYDSYDLTAYATGYYYDDEEETWYYHDASAAVWYYFDSYYELWLGDTYLYNYRSLDFVAREYSEEMEAGEYVSGFGFYSEPGYYIDEYDDWYYLAVGVNGYENGWYYYNVGYGSWEFFDYSYYWQDLGECNPEYDAEWGILEFGEVRVSVYTEPGYYYDGYYDTYYYLEIYEGQEYWYIYEGYYGWSFYDTYYGDNGLEYARRTYSSDLGCERFYGEPYEQGYYKDEYDDYYYYDADGAWYYYQTVKYGGPFDIGWQARYYTDSSAGWDYLGATTGEVPAFNGVGSGAEGMLEEYLAEELDGIEFSITMDFYAGDLLAVNMNFELPTADTEISLDLLMWNVGIENMMKLSAEINEMGIYFESSLSKIKGSSYEGSYKAGVDAGSDSFQIKGSTTVTVEKSVAVMEGTMKVTAGSMSGKGDFSWTQSAPDSDGKSRDTGKANLELSEGSSEIELDLTIDRSVNQKYTEVDPEGWSSSYETFDSLGEVFLMLFTVAGGGVDFY